MKQKQERHLAEASCDASCDASFPVVAAVPCLQMPLLFDIATGDGEEAEEAFYPTAALATPVQEVIQLLEGRSEIGKAELQDEQVQFAAYKQFCDECKVFQVENGGTQFDEDSMQKAGNTRNNMMFANLGKLDDVIFECKESQVGIADLFEATLFENQCEMTIRKMTLQCLISHCWHRHAKPTLSFKRANPTCKFARQQLGSL